MARRLIVGALGEEGGAPSLFAAKTLVVKGDLPHFDLPFRFVSGTVACVPQDSLDDVVNCVEAALRTETGTRKEIPTFGVREVTFQPQPVDMGGVMQHILDHEPRASLISDQHPRALDEFVAEVALSVSSGVETATDEAELEAVQDF
jgi:hypothetical protein